MKERLTTKKINSLLCLLGVLLILLSPCKVRNFIQAKLGVPTTKVLNKSQSRVTSSSCQVFGVADTIQGISKTAIQQPTPFFKEVFWEAIPTFLLEKVVLPQASKRYKHTPIPLYLLYQNFQVYS